MSFKDLTPADHWTGKVGAYMMVDGPNLKMVNYPPHPYLIYILGVNQLFHLAKWENIDLAARLGLYGWISILLRKIDLIFLRHVLELIGKDKELCDNCLRSNKEVMETLWVPNLRERRQQANDLIHANERNRSDTIPTSFASIEEYWDEILKLPFSRTIEIDIALIGKILPCNDCKKRKNKPRQKGRENNKL